MSATDIKDLSDGLVTIATTISSTSTFDGFAEVYDYVPEISEVITEGSPIVVILPTSVTDPISTTLENERIYAYLVDVYVLDDPNTSKSDIEKQLKYSIGHLIQAIDENYNTLGNWLDIQITNWDYAFTDNFRRASITVQIHKLVNIT